MGQHRFLQTTQHVGMRFHSQRKFHCPLNPVAIGSAECSRSVVDNVAERMAPVA